MEVNRMRRGFVYDMLTSVDICEIVELGAEAIEIYEGVIYRMSFEKSPFTKVIETLFALKQKKTKTKITI